MKQLSFILILTLATIAGACSKKTATEPQGDANLPDDVQSVAAAAVTPENAPTPSNGTEANGTWATSGEFISPSRSEVAPKIPGRVAEVYVDEGARVHRGQPLAKLETDYARLDLQRAEAELARARAAEADASRELDRKKELRAKDSIPQSLFDRTQSAWEQATAARQSAEAAVGIARQRLADVVLRSPARRGGRGAQNRRW